MADLVTVIDIAEPMQERQKKDGSGTYRAMRITVKMPDGALKTIQSFDEVKVGEQVPVENKNGYVNIVKASRGGYDKPAQVGFTDVMQALRFQYEATMKLNAKLDAVLRDIGIDPATADSAVKSLVTQTEPPTGFDKFKQSREEHGFTRQDVIPTDDDMSGPLDIDQIPF